MRPCGTAAKKSSLPDKVFRVGGWPGCFPSVRSRRCVAVQAGNGMVAGESPFCKSLRRKSLSCSAIGISQTPCRPVPGRRGARTCWSLPDALRRLAECVSVLCGKYSSTLRKVQFCIPQGVCPSCPPVCPVRRVRDAAGPCACFPLSTHLLMARWPVCPVNKEDFRLVT